MKFSTDFILGLLLGFACAAYASLVGYGYFWSVIWLKDWQSVVNGLLATIAAGGTIWAIGVQVRQSDDHKSEELKRKNLARRIAASQPLSNIMQYQENIILELGVFLSAVPELNSWNSKLQAPNVDDKDIRSLIDCLETATGNATLDIAELITDLQIQTARLFALRESSNSTTIISRQNIISYAVDALTIYARSSRLFRYVRLQDQSYRKNSLTDAVAQSCSILIMRANISEEVERRFARFSDKWLCSKFEGRDD